MTKAFFPTPYTQLDDQSFLPYTLHPTPYTLLDDRRGENECATNEDNLVSAKTQLTREIKILTFFPDYQHTVGLHNL